MKVIVGVFGCGLLLTFLISGCDTSFKLPSTPPEPTLKPSSYVKGIWGTSNGDVFAVCQTEGRATILEGHEDTWQTIWTETFMPDTNECSNASRFYDVWCSSEGSMFAVGSPEAIIQRIPEGDITAACFPPGSILASFNNVYGFSGDDVFVTAYSCLVHFDGNSWSRITPIVGESGSPQFWRIVNIWGPAPDSIFFSDGSVRVWHFDGESLTSEIPFEGIFIGSLWGTSDQDIYATAASDSPNTNYILHRDSDGWSVEAEFDSTELQGLFGFEEGPLFVLAINGQGSRVLSKNGNVWDQHGNFPDVRLLCIWGNNPNNLYVGGTGQSSRHGLIFHFDGIVWKQVLSLAI